MLEDSIAVKADVLVASGSRRWLYVSLPLLSASPSPSW